MWPLSCHTSGCDAALKTLPVADLYSLAGRRTPLSRRPLVFPHRREGARHSRIYVGSGPEPRAPSALVPTAPAPAANRGQSGPLLVPKVAGVRGARLTFSQSGVRRAALPPLWPNQAKPVPSDRSAAFRRFRISTNTVRRIAIAPADPLTDISLDPIEDSSLFLSSLEEVRSLGHDRCPCLVYRRARQN